MFRCQLCNRLSAPRERSCKIVTETREKEYFSEIRGRMHLVGTGTEIVKEAVLCRECAEKQWGMSPLSRVVEELKLLKEVENVRL